MTTPAEELAARIAETPPGQVVDTKLQTSERVLARVTDGIYRQPASALRELISNAYDADASRVVILTDRPRFSRMTVEDDGAGMTPETLAHLLTNIGGSAKRRSEGADLGITSQEDPSRSPQGRRLIGRIGIGLFSVSQLTQTFQITTKVAGDNFRTIATVVMRQYGEMVGHDIAEDGEYEAGRVNIWREPASDVDSHGTTITLDGIRPQTRRTLQSDALWQAVEAADATEPTFDAPSPPRFHIGRVRPGTRDELRAEGPEIRFDSVPWEQGDRPVAAFSKLVDAVWDAIGQMAANPKLSEIFDEYLRLVWVLALSVPLPYVDGHPFEIPFGEEETYTYGITSGRSGAAYPVELSGQQTFADACGLHAQELNADTPFRVIVDDLELRRPLRFTNLPTTAHALKQSIMMVGNCRETFDGVPPELSGGPLDFEAYLLWNPKIAPTEHQGSLIRIHGASGTLFDASFMRYQVSELTRRQQISCEIFVSEGLEGALNIDRESFNFAHPHVVFITAWLHNALRKLATTQKSLAQSIRHEARQARTAAQASQMETIEKDAWAEATGDEDVVPPVVTLAHGDDVDSATPAERERDYIQLDAGRVLPAERPASRDVQLRVERQIAAVASIMAAYGVPEHLTESDFQRMLRAIVQVFEAHER